LAEPIPSKTYLHGKTKDPLWYQLPHSSGDLLGLQIAPWRLGNERVWGKRHTIEFLIRLAKEWLYALRTDFAPILLGDIAPEGGERNPWDKVTDHKSHRSGVDMDIYILRKDGMPLSAAIPASSLIRDPIKRAEAEKKEGEVPYDRPRTTTLLRTVYKVAGPGGIVQVFFDDQAAIDALRKDPLGITTIAPDTGRHDETGKLIQLPTPHRDHFHVRLPAG
jgi:hypothetical protein